MSSMSSLSTALSAMYAQRQGLDVTGHNIANANTEGYTRQRVGLQANQGPVASAMFATWRGVGQGVTVTGIERMRDAFLDLRANQEHSLMGRLSTEQAVLSRIELGFGEPSDVGLAAQLNDYWSGWDDVANNPTDLAARNAQLERGATLAQTLRATAGGLATLRTDITDETRAQVSQVNTMAGAIAELNEDIVNATNAGLSPNDLMDQRDLMVAKLADTIGITLKPGAANAVDIFVGGTALVRGDRAELLQVEDAAGVLSITWSKDGYPADVSGGSVSALLAASNDTIPRYLGMLDAVAIRLRDLTNGAHAEGQDLDGAAGGEFFTGTGAMDIAISADVAGQPRKLAAGATAAGGADGSNALRLAALAGHRERVLNPGDPAYLAGDGPDLEYRSMIVGLGVEANAVNRRTDIQYEITRQVDAAKDAESGVNLDEEMTNMLSYQRAYEAAARYLTAIDQALDRLINSTGLVGR